ncbi:MAG TPA: HD-GYP domain-containing protein [bacterium]|nr:HD-GYP domain-containing protein [bacterium]HEX68052.1 HD-GYP domain-containing protein [bacterium]
MKREIKEKELKVFFEFLEAISDGIILLDKKGKVLYANQTSLQMFGFKHLEEGKGIDALSFVSPEDRKRVSRDLRLLIMGKGKKPAEYRVKKKNGTGFWVEATGSKILIGKKPITLVTVRNISQRKKAEKMAQESLNKLKRIFEETVFALASTIEIRDPYTAGHQRRVAYLASVLGKELGLPEERIEGLRLGALTHDVGKIYVPAEILNKPTKLTSLEFGLIKQHPIIGYNILKGIEFAWPVREMILQHHERLNGSGYPCGLKGDQIIFEARILAVADVVEAMSSYRPYRPALELERALEEISRNKGKLYDPEVVEACIKLFWEKSFIWPKFEGNSFYDLEGNTSPEKTPSKPNER